MSEVERLADEIAAKTDRIDVLINNAGGTSRAPSITAEGNEATFAGNHLGHFLLTHRLMPLIRAAAAGSAPGVTRIISVSSKGHEHAPGLDWNDLQMIRNFVPLGAYCNAKLCNILFTRSLAKRLAGSGIVAHSMHPGLVDTNFASYADDATQAHYTAEYGMVDAATGADTLTWMVDAPEPASANGEYYVSRAIHPTSPLVDDDSAERLWRESEKLAGLPASQPDKLEA
jgi:NAD(P)-dependent dehydrogenase (short-subunit alcohol dehydrogenase family)